MSNEEIRRIIDENPNLKQSLVDLCATLQRATDFIKGLTLEQELEIWKLTMKDGDE